MRRRSGGRCSCLCYLEARACLCVCVRIRENTRSCVSVCVCVLLKRDSLNDLLWHFNIATRHSIFTLLHTSNDFQLACVGIIEDSSCIVQLQFFLFLFCPCHLILIWWRQRKAHYRVPILLALFVEQTRVTVGSCGRLSLVFKRKQGRMKNCNQCLVAYSKISKPKLFPVLMLFYFH